MAMNLPFQPDPLPLREGLRRLRHVVRRGGETAREVAGGAMGGREMCIASRLATAVIAEMERIAEEFDRMASRAARQAFGHEEDLTTTLDELHGNAPIGPSLASTLYTALTLVLKHIGSDTLFVSELAAREAVKRWQVLPGRRRASGGQLAAGLAMQLVDRQVIRGAHVDPRCVVSAPSVRPVAIFAVMLWLLVARSPEESEAALISAADIAAAIAERVALVFAERDETGLIALLEKYRNNV